MPDWALNFGIGGHAQGKGRTDEWLTPPPILDALGVFDLDPCSPVDRPWDTAIKHYTVLDDGLGQPWYGRVWMNPPYGSELPRWLARLAAHGDGIALTFARVETDAFHRFVWPRADGLFFFRGRLNFYTVKGERAKNAGGPSVLIAYGENNRQILETCNLLGKYVPLKRANA